jgi:4-hydroxy-tetrahydrodipicolinate synthase
MLKGSFVALISPLTPDGEVDYASLAQLIDFQIDSGSDGLVVLGTTGECASFSAVEHIALVAWVVDYVVGRIPVIAGNGSNCTRKAIALTAAMEHLPLAAMLSVTPYYNKPSEEGLYQHFKAIAAATSIPQIIYNVPGRTGIDMSTDLIARLSKLPNIIGIKEASGAVNRVQAIKAACQPDFICLSGDDETAKDFMLAGGDGVISVVNNCAPKAFKAMCDAALAGHEQAALELHQLLLPLAQKLFVEANPIPVKWACYVMGLIEHNVLRLPLTPLDEIHVSSVQQALKDVNIRLKHVE